MYGIIRRFVLACGALVLVAWGLGFNNQSVDAGDFPTIINFDCSETSYSIVVDNFYDTTIAIVNADTDQVLATALYPHDDSEPGFELVFNVLSYPRLSGVVTLQFVVTLSIPMSTSETFVLEQATLDCGDPVDEEPFDGRFCFAPGEARVAVYAKEVEGETGLEIWRITDQNTGELVLDITRSQLARFDDARFTQLISEDVFSAVKVYRLVDVPGSNLRYQINAGPYGNERKIHVCLFDAIPPTRIIKTTIEY